MILLYFRAFIIFTVETATVTTLTEQRTDPTGACSPVPCYIKLHVLVWHWRQPKEVIVFCQEQLGSSMSDKKQTVIGFVNRQLLKPLKEMDMPLWDSYFRMNKPWETCLLFPASQKVTLALCMAQARLGQASSDTRLRKAHRTPFVTRALTERGRGGPLSC